MVTRPALCPARSTFWNKTPKSQLPINRISSSFFFVPHLLATLKAIECGTGPSGGTNISKLNFASGRTDRTAGPASSTLVKLSLSWHITLSLLLKMEIRIWIGRCRNDLSHYFFQFMYTMSLHSIMLFFRTLTPK